MLDNVCDLSDFTWLPLLGGERKSHYIIIISSGKISGNKT